MKGAYWKFQVVGVLFVVGLLQGIEVNPCAGPKPPKEGWRGTWSWVVNVVVWEATLGDVAGQLVGRSVTDCE